MSQEQGGDVGLCSWAKTAQKRLSYQIVAKPTADKSLLDILGA